ncbi:hypothetical protein ACWDF9_28310 [Streptomyces rubiginosohelvolus]
MQTTPHASEPQGRADHAHLRDASPLPRFTADLQDLTPAQRRRFRRVVLVAFVPGVHELTWSMGTGPAGRARSLA